MPPHEPNAKDRVSKAGLTAVSPTGKQQVLQQSTWRHGRNNRDMAATYRVRLGSRRMQGDRSSVASCLLHARHIYF